MQTVFFTDASNGVLVHSINEAAHTLNWEQRLPPFKLAIIFETIQGSSIVRGATQHFREFACNNMNTYFKS
jgi:hypothetical protein